MAETKKKIKPGAMSLHPEDLALVVNYEVRRGNSPAIAVLHCAASTCSWASKHSSLHHHALQQVQEVAVQPDGTQQVVSREAAHKK